MENTVFKAMLELQLLLYSPHHVNKFVTWIRGAASTSVVKPFVSYVKSHWTKPPRVYGNRYFIDRATGIFVITSFGHNEMGWHTAGRSASGDADG